VSTSPTAGLESVVAAEHAAIYGYGQAGAALVRLQAPAALLAATRSGYDALRTSRDQLSDAIAAAGGTPPPELAGYALPFPLQSAADVVRLLAGLEDRLCGVAATALEATTGRLLISDVLSAAAVRAVRIRLLGGAPPASAVNPLPGIPGAS
jgi:Domain of unknown function (DUF4439)